MKWSLKMMLPVLVLASCSEKNESLVGIGSDSTQPKEEIVSHEMIVLGQRLDNPYSLTNVSEAIASLYPTKSGIAASDLYVRFLPKTMEEFNLLQNLGLELLDYPMDYEIVQDGDYYRDPSLKPDEISWQYSVVPADFVFPSGIRYEILEECFIPDETVPTRGFEDVDWDAVETESFKLTGNESLLAPSTRSKSSPSGKITIVDDGFSPPKTLGVSGVKVVANCFVKVGTAFTDKNGNYAMDKKFSSKPHYRLCFQNSQGFSIGLNLVLIPASLSALGKGEPEGMDLKVDENSDGALFRRCVVNNSAYDYLAYCKTNGITCPPSNLRIWILNILKPSCSIMMHHGALLDAELVNNYLGMYKILVRLFAPDIVIGSRNIGYDYASLFSTVSHEMAHGSHFAKVGTDFWKEYAMYILSSYLTTGTSYGNGNGENAGYCEVGEMWGFYVENKLYEERYGINPGEGTSYWFYPQIFSALEKEGIKTSDICSAMTSEATDRDELQERLKAIRSDKSSAIKKVFNLYSR